MTPPLIRHLKASGLRSLLLYHDKGMFVLNKPPGLVCQMDRRRGRWQSDEGDAAAYRYNRNTSSVLSFHMLDLLEALRSQFQLSTHPYPVHRLDKVTTGNLILGRTLPMARELSRQFQEGSIEKIYLALVRGLKGQKGTIYDPISYVEGEGSVMDSKNAKPSLTDWWLLDSSHKPIAPVSLVMLGLRTGNKHQLRLHMAQSLKAPILGDAKYDTEGPTDSLGAIRLPPNRVFLHAWKLSFYRYKPIGPNKRIRVGIRAPIPTDFLKICSDLKINLDMEDTTAGLFVNGMLVDSDQIPELEGYLSR